MFKWLKRLFYPDREIEALETELCICESEIKSLNSALAMMENRHDNDLVTIACLVAAVGGTIVLPKETIRLVGNSNYKVVTDDDGDNFVVSIHFVEEDDAAEQ